MPLQGYFEMITAFFSLKKDINMHVLFGDVGGDQRPAVCNSFCDKCSKRGSHGSKALVNRSRCCLDWLEKAEPEEQVILFSKGARAHDNPNHIMGGRRRGVGPYGYG